MRKNSHAVTFDQIQGIKVKMDSYPIISATVMRAKTSSPVFMAKKNPEPDMQHSGPSLNERETASCNVKGHP
jgi:hypothetical protein